MEKYKFVVVLNKKVEIGKVLNATAHMCASLVARASDELKEKMLFVNYADASGGIHPVSGLSLVVLRADNSNKVRKFRDGVIAKDLLHTDFLESMTGGSYEEQVARTSELTSEELEYYGVAVFGLANDIDPLTKKFSLWK